MCTGVCFTDRSGNLYFGRNLDWNCSFGERLIAEPKGHVYQPAFVDATPSPHATIGIGIKPGDIPLYFDCGNDAGLAIAGLNFPGYAQYEPEAVPGKVNIAAYEFPYWVASRFASVDKLAAVLPNVAIVAKPAGESLGVSLLHWMIADASRCIVVEYTESGMHVHENPVGVLANQPDFGWHMENLRTYITATPQYPGTATWGQAELVPFGAGAGMRGVPGDSYSTSRFAKAAFLNANYPAKDSEQDNVARMFRTLWNVAMVEGSAQMSDGTYERTIFTSCYSARERAYYLFTDENPAIVKMTIDGES